MIDVTSEPTSSTMPIGSWPRMSPSFMNGPSTSYRCRSEPQMFVVVIRTIASVGSSIVGIGDLVDRYVALAVPGDCLHLRSFPDARSALLDWGAPTAYPGNWSA